MKEGKAVDKPIYNHVTGALDPPEKIESPDVSRVVAVAADPRLVNCQTIGRHTIGVSCNWKQHGIAEHTA